MVRSVDPERLHQLVSALVDSANRLDALTPRGGPVVAEAADWCRRQVAGITKRLEGLALVEATRSLIGADQRALAAVTGALATVGLGLRAAGLAVRQARDRSWLEPGRQFLLFDPAGEGRVVEVHGDLATAVDVAVVVPGVGTSMATFDRTSAEAGDLAREAGGQAAVIAWLGYDPPDRVPLAMTAGSARTGADGLNSFLAATIPAGVHVTVIGHSYGSLVAGLAVRKGARVDDLVLVGSPGAGARSAGELGLGDGSGVWAARAPGDPIALAVDPREAIGLGLPGAWDAHRRGRLLFGQDPASPGFGAVRFGTGPGVQGHSDYFKVGSVSLENLARIVDGRRAEVILDVG